MREGPDSRALRYVMLCAYRKRKFSEEEIARELKFESPAVLYRALRQDGFPVCQICGATPEGPEHCDPPATKRKRRARQGGGAKELPPAREARDLLRKATQALNKIVDPPPPPIEVNAETFRQYLDSQDIFNDLEEFLQGERFVSSYVHRPDPDEVDVFRREDFTEEGWVEVCDAHGQNPFIDAFVTDSVGVQPQGAKNTPNGMLVKLIGAYVLAGLPLDPLLEKLHPEPDKVDREQLKAFIYGRTTETGRHTEGMMDKVRQIARVVRGGTVRKGPPTEELSREELWTAWEITSWRSQGYSYSQIHEYLQHKGITLSEVTRLGNMRPQKPDTNLER